MYCLLRIVQEYILDLYGSHATLAAVNVLICDPAATTAGIEPDDVIRLCCVSGKTSRRQLRHSAVREPQRLLGPAQLHH